MEGFVVDKVDTQFGLRSDGAVDENGVYYSTKTASVINLDLSCLSCGPKWTFGLRTANANRPSVPLSSLIPLSQRNDPKHRFNSNNHKCSRITYVGGAYALDSCTGRKLWYTGVPYSESSDPVIGDTTIYLGTSSSFLYLAIGKPFRVCRYAIDLIQEIDESLNEMVSTGKLQKLYKQGTTKMYGK
jgi:outer membrane protein assembly factor BamB